MFIPQTLWCMTDLIYRVKQQSLHFNLNYNFGKRMEHLSESKDFNYVAKKHMYYVLPLPQWKVQSHVSQWKKGKQIFFPCLFNLQLKNCNFFFLNKL